MLIFAIMVELLRSLFVAWRKGFNLRFCFVFMTWAAVESALVALLLHRFSQ